MKLLLLVAALMVGCFDEETTPDPREDMPTCASLGCESSFCGNGCATTCGEQACVACPVAEPDCWMSAE
jgi:hypothetical protein